MYCSKQDRNNKSQLYQSDPKYRTGSKFADKGWTDSVSGYCREAKKHVWLMMEQFKVTPAKLHFTLFIGVNGIDESRRVWDALSLRLKRAGIVLIGFREPNKKRPGVHYHCVVTSSHSPDQIRDIVRAVIPKTTFWKSAFRTVGNAYRLACYVTKAPYYANGRDRHAKKRLLFIKKCGLKKVVTVGRFWSIDREQVWSDKVKYESRIGAALTQDVREAARIAADLVFPYPVDRIRRSFAKNGVPQSFQKLVFQNSEPDIVEDVLPEDLERFLRLESAPETALEPSLSIFPHTHRLSPDPDLESARIAATSLHSGFSYRPDHIPRSRRGSSAEFSNRPLASTLKHPSVRCSDRFEPDIRTGP